MGKAARNKTKFNPKIEAGKFFSTATPELAGLLIQSKRSGGKIIDQGIFCPFVISFDYENEPKEILGLAFPSVDKDLKILVGLMVIKISELTLSQATRFFKISEHRLREEISAKFKTAVETQELKLSRRS